MQQYRREFSRSFSTGPRAGLDLRALRGAIRVRGEQRDDVLISVVASFNAESDDDAGEIVRGLEAGLRQSGHRVTADTAGHGRRRGHHGPAGRESRLDVSIDVAAPIDSSAEISLLHGEAEVRGLARHVRLRSVHGSVLVEDAAGDATVHCVKGDVTLRNVGGEADVSLTNGSLLIEGAGGRVRFHLISGRARLVDAGAGVRGRSVSGDVELRGRIAGDVTVESAHGDIVLDVPGDSRFQLDARSSLGSVDSELALDDGGGSDAGERLPRVRLRTQMGSVRLRELRRAEAVPA